MVCRDCLQNCREIVSDQCIEYTGPTLGEPFDVCTGDQLSIFEANIVAAIQGILTGTTALPPSISVSTCAWFQGLFGAQPSTTNSLLQTLITGECTLFNLITNLTTQVNSNQNGTVVDTACLTGLPIAPTTAQITQAIINLLCTINTTVNDLPNVYVKLSDLTSLVTTIVNNILSGGGATPQFNARMVPFTATPYFGPVSNFDSSGAGISSLGYARIFICNGANGTPDIRGRAVVGSIRNVPGGALDPAVDPAVSSFNFNWSTNDRSGESAHTLTVPEIPGHTHTVTDPGHGHTVTASTQGNFSGSGSLPGISFTTAESGGSTNSATTGVSLQQTGGNQPHNNIPPSIASSYIMYIP